MTKPYQKISPVPKTPAAPRQPGRRIQVRRSGVHGKGVYAVANIAAGERLIEYTGEVISWEEALTRHPHDPTDPNHTFYFHISTEQVIDAKVGGNSSRWINHSCNPNCEATQEGSRVFIDALHDIAAGEELFYNYGLVIDERLTPALKAQYPCWCGHATCTGTLLAPKKPARHKAKATG
jgi:SET domain-containing protein